MHSCNIFFKKTKKQKKNSVQILGPIHKKKKFAINTGFF